MSSAAPPDSAELQASIGHRYADVSLLSRALIHSSMRAESDCEDNETLEFLGDAALDLAVSELLMHEHGHFREGELSKARASMVSQRALARIARRLDLGRWLQLGKGEERSGGRDKDRILAGAYEAVIGSVFLDGGYQRCRTIIAAHFADLLAEGGRQADYKTQLQELMQKRFKTTPHYAVATVEGPDHARVYQVEVIHAGRVLARGKGTSRKLAEQIAARDAIETLASDEDPRGSGDSNRTENAG